MASAAAWTPRAGQLRPPFSVHPSIRTTSPRVPRSRLAKSSTWRSTKRTRRLAVPQVQSVRVGSAPLNFKVKGSLPLAHSKVEGPLPLAHFNHCPRRGHFAWLGVGSVPLALQLCSIVQSPPRAVRVGTVPPELPDQAQQGRHKSRGSSSPRAPSEAHQGRQGWVQPPEHQSRGSSSPRSYLLARRGSSPPSTSDSAAVSSKAHKGL